MKSGEFDSDVPKLSRPSPEPIIQPADLDLSGDLLFPETGEDSPQQASGGRCVQQKDKDEQTTDRPDNLAEDSAQQLHDRGSPLDATLKRRTAIVKKDRLFKKGQMKSRAPE